MDENQRPSFQHSLDESGLDFYSRQQVFKGLGIHYDGLTLQEYLRKIEGEAVRKQIAEYSKRGWK